jgi:hypothetical protein
MTEPVVEPGDDGADDVPASAPGPRRAVRRPRGIGLGWLALLVLLGAAVVIGPKESTAGLALPNPDREAVTRLRAAFSALPDRPLVLVAMDADFGTYSEIRPAVRAAFDDLLRRGASLAMVSVTAEGRAIAAAELARLRVLGAREGVLLDLGYVAGVEAGIVRLVRTAIPESAAGSVADAVRERGGGLGAFDMTLLVGGTDVGPRTWIEQAGSRVPALAMVAIAPTFAQPELSPYLRTGQLAGLLATVRDGAAYAETIGGEGLAPLPDEPQRERLPSALAMLTGMIVALLVLARLLLGALPGLGGRPVSEVVDEDQP